MNQLEVILKARDAWEAEYGRHCVAVHASQAVLDAMRSTEVLSLDDTVVLSRAPGLRLSRADGLHRCDWYLDATLQPGAFRFE